MPMELIGKLVLKVPSGQEEEFALAKASVTIGRAAAGGGHGALHVDNDVKMRLKLELTR